jgi:hypothetical protein
MTKTPQRPSDLANGETGEGERTPRTSGAGVANAPDRWDEEGGTPALPWPLPYETASCWRLSVVSCNASAPP